MKKEELIDSVSYSEEELLSNKRNTGLKKARVMYHAGLVEKCGYTLAETAVIAQRSERTISRSIKNNSSDVPAHAQKLIDLAEGVTAEVMMPDYTTVRQPEVIFRMDNNGRRYYYKFDENQEPIFLTSMTALIKNTLPMSEEIFKWAVNNFKTYNEYIEYVRDRAFYGTFLHLQCAKLLMKQKYVINDMKDYLQLYIDEHKLNHSFMSYLSDLKKDLMAFAKFVIDRKLKVIAIEMVLSSKDGYGGALDIVAEMYAGEVYKSGARVGLPKEDESIRAEVIIDIKSGRKGFYESSEIQLGGYKEMWNEHFPERKIERIYNWSPAEWSTVPKYKLKEQTNSNNLKKLPLLVELNKIVEEGRVKRATTIGGAIDLEKESYGTVNVRELKDIVMDRQ